MKPFACQYAIIRFLPYAETGEFANVGVVLACPATGYLDACLMPLKKTGRITGFFERLDKRIYREAMNYLREELDRINKLTQEHAESGRKAITQQIFAGLTKPREALLRFSDVRVILAGQPDETLNALFARFVERDFASKDYHDQILNRGVRETLRKANLRDLFVEARIGNDDLHVNVPFVHRRGEHAQLAIKPLDLAKDEPNKVFEIGGHWVDRVRRLAKRKLLPEKVLFALNLPDPGELATRRAADEIVCELREQGIKIAAVTDTAAIAEFAAGATRH